MDKVTLRVPFSQAERNLGRIGRDGEATVRQVLFDCRDVLRGHEGASIVCAYWRPEDTNPYLVPLIRQEDGVFAFVVRGEDVAKNGTVRMELRRIEGESVLKSAVYTATVEESLNAAPVDPGSPVEDMLTELGEAAGQARAAAESAAASAAKADTATANATTAASNAQSVADTVQAKLDNGEFKGAKGDTGAQGPQGIQGIQGDKGDTGAQGADGISPTVTTSKSGDTTTVTITDKDGAHVATIKDGAKGADGAKGDDGFNPSVKVTKSGDTATITATDKDGTTSAEVKDGSDATVTKQAIVDALGYTPAAEEGTYELIETITLTEDAVVERSAEPDGTPYNFDAVTIKYSKVATDKGQSGIGMYAYCKTAWVGYLYYTLPSAKSYLVHRFFKSGGYWDGSRYISSTSVTDYGSIVPTGHGYLFKRQTKSLPTITSIKSSAAFIAGTTLEIYGIRAK